MEENKNGPLADSFLKNILIADDEFDLLSAASSILSEYDPLPLSSPSAAIDAITVCDKPFFLVISDYDFKDPELNGLSIYNEYRRRFPVSPFIFYTTELPVEVAKIVHSDRNAHLHPKTSSLLVLLRNHLASREFTNSQTQFKEEE